MMLEMAMESTFAVESQMDELAARLGLDRLELRRRNATKPGDANPQGFVIGSCAMRECLDPFCVFDCHSLSP